MISTKKSTSKSEDNMKVAIIGSNGMLSKALTQLFYANGHEVLVWGLDEPLDYAYTWFFQCDLLKGKPDYSCFLTCDIVIYAAGAGVQAALSTPSALMYALNVTAPISITLGLKDVDFQGTFISFGSYMEVGLNQIENDVFTEDEIVCSTLPVTNDYALSKRLFSRYMRDINVSYRHWHFILPNMFSTNDIQPGTRLIPYVIQCISDMKAGKDVIPSFSAGIQIRQFIQLEELYDVLSNAYENELASGVYNVGGGEIMSIKELIQRVFNFYNMPCRDEWFGKEVRRDNDIMYLALNGENLLKHIGFVPKRRIEDLLNTNVLKQ